MYGDFAERCHDAGYKKGYEEGYREGVKDATEAMRVETEIKIENIRGELLDE